MPNASLLPAWIDTHIHLDAAEYGSPASISGLLASARTAGVGGWVIPAVAPSNFRAVRDLANATIGACYALGIHPMYVQGCEDDALDVLAQWLAHHASDPKLVAVGEIGLDYFVPELTQGAALARQQRFFKAQLKLAQRYDLPVLLHVRRAQDHIAAAVRKQPVAGGIAHAFNGSVQQARVFTDLGLKLGFGGAATYNRALQIREHIRSVPACAIVLETDGPDIAPEWLARQVNPPAALADIGVALAALRGMPVDEFAALCAANSRAVLPRMRVGL